MSEQETLRLVAEVVDKYSGPLKNMMDALKKIGDGSKKVHDAGRKNVDDHQKAYRELREQLVKVKDTTTDVLRPAFSALGVSVLGIAGSIAAVSEAVKSFGEYGQRLEFAHRASSLLTGTVRGLAEANEQYGVSAEETTRALEQFGAHMDELHRKSPAYINAWKALGANALRDIGSPLMALDGHREEQLKRAMELIPRIRDIDQRRRVLALLGLPENWAYLTDKEMAAMRAKADSFNREFPFNEEAAKRAKKSWDDLLTTMRGVRDMMAGEVAGGMAGGLRDLNELIKSSEWKTFKDDTGAIGGYLSSWNIGSLKSDMQDLKVIIDGLKWFWDLIKSGPGGADRWWNRPLFKGPNALLGGNQSGSAKDFSDALRAQGEIGSLAPGGQQDRKTQDNVKEGVRKGLEEFYGSLKQQNAEGGYTPMAFHPSSGGSRGWAFGSREFPAVGDAGAGSVPRSMGKDASGASVPLDASGGPTSGSLAEQRRRFGQELQNNPALRNKVMRIMANEQGRNPAGTQGIAESMMNRAIVRGTSLEKQARWHESEGGYYQQGNMGRGALETPNHRAVLENSLKNALAGSDIVNGATDNSSGGLAAREKATGKFRWLRDINGESFFAPGWGEQNLASRWDQWKRSGASLRDMVRRGGRPPSDAELLRRGMKASDAGGLSGSAKLDITLNGFPKGTRTAQSADGIFKQVTLNRGRPMLMASELS